MEQQDQDRFEWFMSVVRSLHAATIDMLPAYEVNSVENKPLTRLIKIPLQQPLPSKSHNLIRAILQIRCKEGDCQLEKVSFSAKEVLVRIVMERRIRPVWRKAPSASS